MKTFHPRKWLRLRCERAAQYPYYFVSDKWYLKRRYKKVFGKELDLSNPQTFNEKLQWLKLYDRNPLYHQLVDKCAVKKYVSEKIGAEYVIPSLGEFRRYEDIDFSKLPNQFVMKCNHDSASVMVCRDKSTFDFHAAEYRFSHFLNLDYYHNESLQWAYKDIPPMIQIEQYMQDGNSDMLRDYKFFCFNGEPKFMYCSIKSGDVYENFYDMKLNPLPIEHGFHRSREEDIRLPQNFELMKKLAAKLSEGIPMVRMDFFEINGKVYFGEYTFYDWGGFMPFKTEDWDREIGQCINLSIAYRYKK